MRLQIGEAFAGDGVDAAHVNTMLGDRDGPAGTAWASALATPRVGHIPFMVVLKPSISVKPATLFVNKAPIDPANERHSTLTWGAAQAGVAKGVTDALRAGVIPPEPDSLVCITAVWVNPAADDEEAVFTNNAVATLAALRAGRDMLPTLHEVLDAGEPENPHFRT